MLSWKPPRPSVSISGICSASAKHRTHHTFTTRNKIHAAMIAPLTIPNICPSLALISCQPISPGTTHGRSNPSALHDRPTPPVLLKCPHVRARAAEQASEAEHAEDRPQRLRGFLLHLARRGLDVVCDDDGGADDGHVDGEAQPGEEGALVGAVVAHVGLLVGEEEGTESRAGEERVRGAGGVVVGPVAMS